VFYKFFFRVFSLPFFDHDIRVFIKNVFRTFPDDFFTWFLARDIRVFLEKIFLVFFPPIFWSLYSCVYKKNVFALFRDDFFPSLFACKICVFLEKFFFAFFSPIFFHNIHELIKNVISHFFQTIFSHRL